MCLFAESKKVRKPRVQNVTRKYKGEGLGLFKVCLFATGLKKTKVEDKQCHTRTILFKGGSFFPSLASEGSFLLFSTRNTSKGNPPRPPRGKSDF